MVFDEPWNNYTHWAVYTPNVMHTSIYENPSIVASNDGVQWEIPEGLSNPIEPQPATTRDHNCDADMIYNPKMDALMAYWNWADDQYGGEGAEIRLRVSYDGIHWGIPVTYDPETREWAVPQNEEERQVSDGETDYIMVIHSAARYDMLSPTFVYDDYRDVFIMWSNDAGDVGYTNGQNNRVRINYSDDGINWGNPVPVENFLARDENGSQLAPWHQDVQYVKELRQFLCLSQCFAGPNPDGSVLYLTTSRDGLHWEQPSIHPLLSPGTTGSWDDFQIYRSSLTYDSTNDMVRVWYSALQDNTAGKMVVDSDGELTIQAKSGDARIWRIGYAENSYADMMRALLDEPDYTVPALVSGQSLTLYTDGSSNSFSVGDTVQLEWYFTPADTSDQVIRFTSSNPNVVSVDANGIITGMSVGTARITGQTQEGIVGTFDVTVKENYSVRIPQNEMSATASSEYDGTSEGPAANALDGNPDTIWHTNYNPMVELPQHIMINLGKTRLVNKLVYTPRQNGLNGIVLEYGLYAGIGGDDATLVAHGEWSADHNDKTIEFAPVEADKLVLLVIDGYGGYGTAAEINVYEYTGPSVQIPQSEMTATATSENVDGEPVGHVVDGQVNTIWHTNYIPSVDSLPQSVTVRLKNAKAVNKFVYTPRQDMEENGNVLEYELSAELMDGTTKSIEHGYWTDDNNAKAVDFETVEAVAFTLTVIDGHGGFGSAAEINLYGPTGGEVDPDPSPKPDPETDDYSIYGNGVRVVFNEKTGTLSLYKNNTLLGSSTSLGYPIINDKSVQDFSNYVCEVSKGITGKLGEGDRMAITATSDSTGLIREINIETTNEAEGLIFVSTSYRSPRNDIAVEWFVGTTFELTHRSDRIWSYNGGGEGPSHSGDTLLKIDLTDSTKFSRENKQDYTAASIPVSDIYTDMGGITIGDASPTRREVHTPIEETDTSAQVSIEWPGKTVEKDKTIECGQNFVVVHKGDYYNGLRGYKLGMESLGVCMLSDVAPRSYELRWESWGWEFDWTIDLIISKLDELKAAGIKQITLDDGWYDSAGDWGLNPTKFPNGTNDMLRLTDAIHEHGMSAILWWRPCDGGENSKLYQEHPEYFVKNEDGTTGKLDGAGRFGNFFHGTGYALCPCSEGAIRSQVEFINRAMNEWGFDGFKGDFVWSMPKCYDQSHNHPYPEESTEKQSEIYRAAYEAMIKNDPDAFNLLCNCGTPQDFYSLQYVTQVATADPTSLDQTRRRVKAYKALMGDYFPVTTDHNDIWYATAVGTGAVLIEKRAFSGVQEAEYEKWLRIASETGLHTGRFVGDLYCYGYDPYETYVVEKDQTMYYAFYRDGIKFSPVGNPTIELKGLDPNKMYRVVDYTNNEVVATNLTGDNAKFNYNFSNYLLVKAVEITVPDPEIVDPEESFTSVNATDEAVTYSGVWSNDYNSLFYDGEARYTTEEGAFVEFTFIGTGVRWYGQNDINFGHAEVYIDDHLAETISVNGPMTPGKKLFEVLDLPYDTHTIKVVCLSPVIDIDRFSYTKVISNSKYVSSEIK